MNVAATFHSQYLVTGACLAGKKRKSRRRDARPVVKKQKRQVPSSMASEVPGCEGGMRFNDTLMMHDMKEDWSPLSSMNQ